MPKIEMEVRKVGSTDSWVEEYVIDDIDPDLWASQTIAKFNATLYPHEKPRELIGVKIVGEEDRNPEHDWEKSNLITIVTKTKNYDTMKCKKCGVTGKRIGLSNHVQIDSKYRAKKYEFCRR